MQSLSNFYHDLIIGIPNEIEVIETIQGKGWTLVQSDVGTGLATTYSPQTSNKPLDISKGLKLRDLVSWVNSWDFSKASLGLAAINSYWNSDIQLRKNFHNKNLNPKNHLVKYLEEAQHAGKIVGSIGNFPFLNCLSQDNLFIFELNPRTHKEYPATTANYLLPNCDIVLITASTIINKSFEPLMRLCLKAEVWLLGPSTPFNPKLFSQGVNSLGGLYVEDSDEVKKVIRSGLSRELMRSRGVSKIESHIQA